MFRSAIVTSVFLFAAATEIVTAEFYQTPGFSVYSGFEYQTITQEYYNAIIDTTTIDPIERWTLARDEINDLLFRTDIGYILKNPGRMFDISSDLEISDERFLGSIESQLHLGDLDDFFRIFARYENKSIFEEDLSYHDDYHFVEGHLKGGRSITDKSRIELKTGFESVIFDNIAAVSESDSVASFRSIYNYDYSIVSGQVSGEINLGEFTHNLYWSARYNHRFVPDSAEAVYNDIRFSGVYSTVSLEGYFSIEGDFQVKNYSQPDRANDFSDLILRSHLSKNIGAQFEASLAMNFESYWYRKIDYANQDYRLVRTQLNFTHQIKNLHLGPLFRLEFKDETKYAGTSDSYTQWEFGAISNIFSQGSLFCDLEATYGQRVYHDEQTILTSYNFYALSIIANYIIYKGLSVDLIFDGNFEKHDQSQQNSNLYLLTLGLNARF